MTPAGTAVRLIQVTTGTELTVSRLSEESVPITLLSQATFYPDFSNNYKIKI